MAAPEVLVIGDANPDLVLTGDVDPRFGQVEKLVDTASLVLGGSGAIVAGGSGSSRCAARRWRPSSATTSSAASSSTSSPHAGVDTSWVRTDPDVASPVTRGAVRR